MEPLNIEEVRTALINWLGPEGIVDVSRETENDKITGWIVHRSFTGVSHEKRQAWLWDGFPKGEMLENWPGLRERFGPRSVQIGLILTFSPAEYENALDESA